MKKREKNQNPDFGQLLLRAGEKRRAERLDEAQRKQRIQWVERKLQERIAYEEGDIRLDPDGEGVPERGALELWLSKERHGHSWQRIANKFFPEIKSKAAAMSKARRVHGAVERGLFPDENQQFRRHLAAQIKIVFHCTPEQFKSYLDSIPSRIRRKQ